MSGVIAVGVTAVFAAVCGALLRRSNKEVALLLSLAACAVIALYAVTQAGEITAILEGFGALGAFEEILSVMLRALGIVLVGRLAVSVCRDAGESALAAGVEFAVKTAVLLAALPLLQTLLEVLREMLAL